MSWVLPMNGIACPVALVAVMLACACGRLFWRGGRSAGRHRRGTRLIDRPALPGRRWAGLADSRLTLAGVRVSLREETKHFKMLGTTGTGKSTAIHELLEAALRRGDRAVIADPDGGYLRRFYDSNRGDVILNPFEPASARWDLFGE